MTEPDEPDTEPLTADVPDENKYQVTFEASGEVGQGTAPDDEDGDS
jgi:hypothetical protein